MRAAISAIAEHGFAKTQIADIVERARVSRSSFYAVFDDKKGCFVEAYFYGLGLILRRLTEWAVEHGECDPRSQLARGVAAYLRLATEEPEFARFALIELQAIGTRGLEARTTGHEQVAAILQFWHGSARQVEPSWPPVPVTRYAAAVGAGHDLLFATVARGGDPADLHATMVDAISALLDIPPRSAENAPSPETTR